jgi:hypothetical protein
MFLTSAQELVYGPSILVCATSETKQITRALILSR